MAYVMAAWNWLGGVANWIRTGDRADAIYFCLAAALLIELTFRVLRRFIADQRLKVTAARGQQRLRQRRTPNA